MLTLLAVVAITVFACWFVDNLAALGLFEKAPSAAPVLKLVILAVAIFIIAKGAGFI